MPRDVKITVTTDARRSEAEFQKMRVKVDELTNSLKGMGKAGRKGGKGVTAGANGMKGQLAGAVSQLAKYASLIGVIGLGMKVITKEYEAQIKMNQKALSIAKTVQESYSKALMMKPDLMPLERFIALAKKYSLESGATMGPAYDMLGGQLSAQKGISPQKRDAAAILGLKLAVAKAMTQDESKDVAGLVMDILRRAIGTGATAKGAFGFTQKVIGQFRGVDAAAMTRMANKALEGTGKSGANVEEIMNLGAAYSFKMGEGQEAVAGSAVSNAAIWFATGPLKNEIGKQTSLIATFTKGQEIYGKLSLAKQDELFKKMPGSLAEKTIIQDLLSGKKHKFAKLDEHGREIISTRSFLEQLKVSIKDTGKLSAKSNEEYVDTFFKNLSGGPAGDILKREASVRASAERIYLKKSAGRVDADVKARTDKMLEGFPSSEIWKGWSGWMQKFPAYVQEPQKETTYKGAMARVLQHLEENREWAREPASLIQERKDLGKDVYSVEDLENYEMKHVAWNELNKFYNDLDAELREVQKQRSDKEIKLLEKLNPGSLYKSVSYPKFRTGGEQIGQAINYIVDSTKNTIKYIKNFEGIGNEGRVEERARLRKILIEKDENKKLYDQVDAWDREQSKDKFSPTEEEYSEQYKSAGVIEHDIKNAMKDAISSSTLNVNIEKDNRPTPPVGAAPKRE